MTSDDSDAKSLEIARRWCKSRGDGWQLLDRAGRGGTAPVYTVSSPRGELALKLLDEAYSSGDARAESLKRIQMQCALIGDHDCPYLVKIYGGGEFEDRLFLLMNKAPGAELASKLQAVPRESISSIVDQIAKACIFLRKRGLCHRDIKSENIFISDDFSHATLLDVSVVRKIFDPIGIGTDHGNRLPVVATSRYTPPEYLFRLIDPGEELWHALDVYQLGCLIHDLVMRVQMFDEEYQRAADNRYRFAWIVATRTPRINAADVDAGLMLLGQRALDKDHHRRSSLRLEDFLSEKESRNKIGLEAIGMGAARSAAPSIAAPPQLRQLLNTHAKTLEEQFLDYQREKGVTAEHSVKPKDDLHWIVTFEWKLKEGILPEVLLAYEIRHEATENEMLIGLSAKLVLAGDGDQLSAELQLPAVPISDATDSILFANAVEVLSELAGKIMNERTGG